MSTTEACRTNGDKALEPLEGKEQVQTKRNWHDHYQDDYARQLTERRMPKRTLRPNPLGWKCLVCGRVIEWRYQDGAEWESPRFYCLREGCQRVRAVRSKGADLVCHQDRLSNRSVGRREGTS